MAIKTRTDIVNHLIRRNGYRRYLEIGVRRPEGNFARVRAAEKHGVDPDPLGEISHTMTSDEFFAQLGPDEPPYDIVLIDGLHLDHQVMKDVENALEHLSEGGAIVLHDVNPVEESQQVEEYDGVSSWTGTVWKAWAHLRMTRPDLAMCVVDTDHGVGVIMRGRQETYPRRDDAELTWELLDGDREALLNLVPPNRFTAVAAGMSRHGEVREEPLMRRLLSR